MSAITSKLIGILNHSTFDLLKIIKGEKRSKTHTITRSQIPGEIVIFGTRRQHARVKKFLREEYADLLEEAGVDTVKELAQRKPENLYNKLVEVNAAKNLVRQLPGQSQVADWVAQAKKLPRAVFY